MEKEIFKPCVKISKYVGKIDKFILFPYNIKNGKVCGMKEEELKNSYPMAYQYLSENKEELMKRYMDKNTDWFLYARSQGLQVIIKPKLVISKLISNSSKLYQIPSGVVTYSGINIMSEKNLDEIFEKLNTQNFIHYLMSVGKDKSGGYKEISPKFINNYRIHNKKG